ADEKLRQVVVRWNSLRDRQCVERLRPRGAQHETMLAIFSQKQHAARAIEDLRDRTDRRAAHIRLFHRGKRLNETQPLEAVVVLVTVEVLADEDSCTSAKCCRLYQPRINDLRRSKEYHLADSSPFAA